MRRRVVKYKTCAMSLPRFSVEDAHYRGWWLPIRWRPVATFDTLAEAVTHYRKLQAEERERRDAQFGEHLEIVLDSLSPEA